MGKHAIEYKAQEQFIIDSLTRHVAEEFALHPRRHGTITVGMIVTAHYEEFRRSFTGTVTSVEPLKINWRY